MSDKDYESGETYALRLTSVDIAVAFHEDWDKEEAHEAICARVEEAIRDIHFFDGNSEIENDGDARVDVHHVEDHTIGGQ